MCIKARCKKKFNFIIKILFLEDDFHAIQKNFLDNYWDVFEPAEENKLIYTNIFNEYVSSSVMKITNFLYLCIFMYLTHNFYRLRPWKIILLITYKRLYHILILTHF